ncbi:alpha/beta fold hydrolase [Psychrobacillus sp. OK032]|uniref:alpha/beta fold hydrolase n=1 Tax=Psychrobacillus sp. OK032 TaxID=1884358 RepID=UPI0008D4E96C|nr:alpha/beta hydrolase [Psychrobacillus sp. OK032]SES45162.1 Pimeloyl-ACP methyl ester carboxylesterase [Psychrobacillus sp. OK032]
MGINGFYITVSGIKIYCETNNGPENGDTIICLHTAGRENRQYHDMMEILKDKYQMISFDMPAHGKSWPLAGNKVINNYVDYGKFVWAVIEELGVKDPIVIGCSMGGNIVYHLAQEYPVKAICSMQGSDYTPTIDEKILELLNHPYVNPQHSHLEFSECLIGSATTQERRDFILWGVMQEIGITKQGDLTQYNGFDVREKMDQVTCPVLVVHGLDDKIATGEMAEATMSRLTNCKTIVYRPIEDYGHFILVENPELVSVYLDEFIQMIDKQGKVEVLN